MEWVLKWRRFADEMPPSGATRILVTDRDAYRILRRAIGGHWYVEATGWAPEVKRPEKVFDFWAVIAPPIEASIATADGEPA